MKVRKCISCADLAYVSKSGIPAMCDSCIGKNIQAMASRYVDVVCDKCNSRTQEKRGAAYTCTHCLVYGGYEIGYPSFAELEN